MRRLPRVVATVVGAAVVWLVAAGEVPSHARLPLRAVVVGAMVSQPFGCTPVALEPYAPTCPSHHFHAGVDLAAPAGTEVYSATAGVAQTAFDATGAGLYVSVAFGQHVRVLYCHLARLRVSSGEAVVPGQLLGLVGMTGLATGPHVHLQVEIDHRPVDPVAWLATP